MLNKTSLIIATLFCFQYTMPSETKTVDITHISRQAQDSQDGNGTLKAELSDDSFFQDVESIYDPTEGEILDEANLLGTE